MPSKHQRKISSKKGRGKANRSWRRADKQNLKQEKAPGKRRS